jgi:hypothetical protein
MRRSPRSDPRRSPREASGRPRKDHLASISVLLVLLATFAGCDTAEDDRSSCAGPVSRTVILGVTDGLVFDTGDVTAEAEALTSDLVSYKSGSTVDLKSGIEVGTIDRLPLRWFRSLGGKGILYGSLDEVPWELPTNENLNEFLHGPEPGFAFTVANLLSKGDYTRVFIEDYNDASGAVTLRYETVPPPCK